MTSAMLVATSLMREVIGNWWKCGNHRVCNLASKGWVSNQPPEIGRLRIFLGIVPLPLVWCGPARDADFRVYEIVIRLWCFQKRSADINAANQSAVCLFCHDIIRMCLSRVTVSALEGLGHATFEGCKKSVQKSEIIVLCETSSRCRFR